MEIKQIKKALLKEEIRISSHAKERMTKRGYTYSDLISCIWGGELTKKQFFRNRISMIVEGNDMDGFPIVLVVGKDETKLTGLVIISVFPPIKGKYKNVI